jgi:hypothetical protein
MISIPADALMASETGTTDPIAVNAYFCDVTEQAFHSSDSPLARSILLSVLRGGNGQACTPSVSFPADW